MKIKILTPDGDPVIPDSGTCGDDRWREQAKGGTWQQQMKAAVRDVAVLQQRLSLPPWPVGESTEQFPLFVPLPYLSRIRPGDPHDPLLRQVLPASSEDDSPSHFTADPLNETAFQSAADGLLQKYRGRVLVVVNGTCAIHCRYCFRRHFSYPAAPSSASRWDAIIASVSADDSIREVILSGGDPLTVADESLAQLIARLNTIEHLKRIRIHTRLPIVIPQRVSDELMAWVQESRLPIHFVVHANHPAEIDSAVAASMQRLKPLAASLLNQSVLLRGVNDNAQSLIKLSELLIDAGVMPYYLHQLDAVIGAAHFEVSQDVGRQIIAEMRANLPGYGVPRYVQEIPGKPNKTVLA